MWKCATIIVEFEWRVGGGGDSVVVVVVVVVVHVVLLLPIDGAERLGSPRWWRSGGAPISGVGVHH